jgi:hypothetical protein
MDTNKIPYVTNRKDWRRWLTKNHRSETEIWLIYYRKMTRAGLAAVAHVFDPERDRSEEFVNPTDILNLLKDNKQAWYNFQ